MPKAWWPMTCVSGVACMTCVIRVAHGTSLWWPTTNNTEEATESHLLLTTSQHKNVNCYLTTHTAHIIASHAYMHTHTHTHSHTHTQNYTIMNLMWTSWWTSKQGSLIQSAGSKHHAQPISNLVLLSLVSWSQNEALIGLATDGSVGRTAGLRLEDEDTFGSFWGHSKVIRLSGGWK